jgi:hypothetical protein
LPYPGAQILTISAKADSWRIRFVPDLSSKGSIIANETTLELCPVGEFGRRIA